MPTKGLDLTKKTANETDKVTEAFQRLNETIRNDIKEGIKGLIKGTSTLGDLLNNVADRFLDLALNKPAGFIASIISSWESLIISSGVSANANSCLQATAVLLSCDCADNITPIKLVYAFEYIFALGFLFE